VSFELDADDPPSDVPDGLDGIHEVRIPCKHDCDLRLPGVSLRQPIDRHQDVDALLPVATAFERYKFAKSNLAEVCPVEMVEVTLLGICSGRALGQGAS